MVILGPTEQQVLLGSDGLVYLVVTHAIHFEIMATPAISHLNDDLVERAAVGCVRRVQCT